MLGNELVPLRDQLVCAYSGKTVLVTGHTGFKGSWLSEWLLALGARVIGVALAPLTDPALFDQLQLANRLDHHLVDIRDRAAFTRLVLAAEPDFVFHLAAQPLVRISYKEPVETYATNVLGTVHLLEALRLLQARYLKIGRDVCATVFITSDKCYSNREWLHAYREEDAMGGYDPYSSSKACAELAIASFRQSFFNPEQVDGSLRVGIASARAGNVIGGGDWALDRIVPDCVRALQLGAPISVRNPTATRPWQHVLEPLGGYLQLAMRQRTALEAQDPVALQSYCSAFNFGPGLASNRPVSELLEEMFKHWHGCWEKQADSDEPHEAGKLSLAWDKAFHLLNWQPVWSFEETVAKTVQWYRSSSVGDATPQVLTRRDIQSLFGLELGLPIVAGPAQGPI